MACWPCVRAMVTTSRCVLASRVSSARQAPVASSSAVRHSPSCSASTVSLTSYAEGAAGGGGGGRVWWCCARARGMIWCAPREAAAHLARRAIVHETAADGALLRQRLDHGHDVVVRLGLNRERALQRGGAARHGACHVLGRRHGAAADRRQRRDERRLDAVLQRQLVRAAPHGSQGRHVALAPVHDGGCAGRRRVVWQSRAQTMHDSFFKFLITDIRAAHSMLRQVRSPSLRSRSSGMRQFSPKERLLMCGFLHGPWEKSLSTSGDCVSRALDREERREGHGCRSCNGRAGNSAHRHAAFGTFATCKI